MDGGSTHRASRAIESAASVILYMRMGLLVFQVAMPSLSGTLIENARDCALAEHPQFKNLGPGEQLLPRVEV